MMSMETWQQWLVTALVIAAAAAFTYWSLYGRKGC